MPTMVPTDVEATPTQSRKRKKRRRLSLPRSSRSPKRWSLTRPRC